MKHRSLRTQVSTPETGIRKSIVKTIKIFLTTGVVALALSATAFAQVSPLPAVELNGNPYSNLEDAIAAIGDIDGTDVVVVNEDQTSTVPNAFSFLDITGTITLKGNENASNRVAIKTSSTGFDGRLLRMHGKTGETDALISIENLSFSGTADRISYSVGVTSIYNFDTAEIKNSDFTNNKSYAGGIFAVGAIHIDGGKVLRIEDTDFLSNTGEQRGAGSAQGGGLGTSDITSVSIKGIDSTLTFSGNIIKTTSSSTGTEASGGGFAYLLGGTFAPGGVDPSIDINLDNVEFKNNSALFETSALVVGEANVARGGGVFIVNDGNTNVGIKSTFTETLFSENKAIASNVGAAQGGAVFVSNEDTGTTLVFSNSTFIFNEASSNAQSSGGAVFISNDEETTNIDASFNNTLFRGNKVVTDSSLSDDYALGGAIYFSNKNGTGELEITDSSFIRNRAEATKLANTLGGNDYAAGGAIWTDSDMKITADTENVVFRGNTVVYSDGSGGTVTERNSIASGADVDYEANNGKMIFDYDGIKVDGTVTFSGDGTGGLALFDGNLFRLDGPITSEFTQHIAGDYDIQSGNFYSQVNNSKSSVAANNGTGTGTWKFGIGTTWSVDVRHANHDSLVAGIGVSNVGWGANLGGANTALEAGLFQHAIIRVVADDNDDSRAALFGEARGTALMSDIRNSALMMHRRDTVRLATTGRIDDNFLYYSMAGKSGCKTGCDISCSPKKQGGSIWANYVGRYGELDSTVGGQFDLTSHGVQLGVDLYADRCSQYGIMFGYERHESEQSSDKIEADDYYVGLYGAKRLANGYDVRAMFGYGRQNYDMTRYNNYFGLHRLDTSFDGDVFEANIELGRRFQLNRCLSYRPVIGLDYINNDIDGVNEGINGVNYHDNSLSQLALRIGTDLQLVRQRLTLGGGVYYSYQMLSDGDSIDSTVSYNGFSSRLRGCDLGNSTLTLNAGLSYAMNAKGTLSLFGGYTGDIYLDRDGTPMYHSGSIGLMYRY